MTWNQGFTTGLIITIIVTLLTPLVQWVTHTIISPDFFEYIRAYSVEQGLMRQDEAVGYFNLSAYIVQSMIGALGMGIITSAIVAFFIRTKDS
jgi:hypothetical protein